MSSDQKFIEEYKRVNAEFPDLKFSVAYDFEELDDVLTENTRLTIKFDSHPYCYY